jgi:phosphoenolpyruvate carboxykinase (ATP)
MSTIYDGKRISDKIEELIERSRHVGRNVTSYTGPELGRLAESAGQRDIYGGYNWDTHVRNRSEKYTAIVGTEAVATKNPSKFEQEALAQMPKFMVRLFGGEYEGKRYPGHTNLLPIDYIYRVMGSGEDMDFTFNCELLVSTKNRHNHHIGYMWGKMLRAADLVPLASNLRILIVPEIHTGDFGRFWAFPEQGITIGVGSDYMGECKKGFLRMAMWLAKQRGILGIHAASKIVVARSPKTGQLRRIGVIIFGLSGTGKTTNVGHTHYLDQEGEQSLVVQDDFVGLRLRDGRILGTEQALFLKTDLDEDDILLRPATQSPEFVAQNLYHTWQGEVLYLEEDICANGRGILPLKALPADRRYHSIDLPPMEDLDEVHLIINTRRNTVVPIMQELSLELSAAYFMLGESIETAAGDPSKAGQSVRVVGTNPFIVGDRAEEGNIFFEFINRYRDKIRTFVMNTGGVGEIPNPADPPRPKRPATRPWKNGIGYISRAVFRDTAVWAEDPDFGTRVVIDGVTDEQGREFDMDRFDPRKAYGAEEREALVKALNRERVEYLDQFAGLDPKIREALVKTHRL